MNIRGYVKNGVVVLDDGLSLPEGMEVVVCCNGPVTAPPGGERVAFPLVRSRRPGSVALTNERVAEILEEEDVSPGH